MFTTFISIPSTIAINNSKVFDTSSPATILEGLAEIVLFVVDSENNIAVYCNGLHLKI